MMFGVLIGILLGSIIYLYFIKPTKYWKDRGVSYLPAWPVIGSNVKFLLRKEHFMDFVINLYRKFPNLRYVGYMQFTRPTLMIRNIDLIKQITIKDFDHFPDHQGIVDLDSENETFLQKALVSLKGEQWRQTRAALSPAFTSSKMKSIYLVMTDCAKNFAQYFEANEETAAIEMKDVFSKFANDIIASSVFGIKVDSLKDPKNDFFVMGKSFTEFSAKQTIKLMVIQLMPPIAKLLKLSFLPESVSEFFRGIVEENIARRDKEKIHRPDMVQILMDARAGGLKNDEKNEMEEGFSVVEESHFGKTSAKLHLTKDDIVAQAMLFFFAGFDTVSTASSFLAYELAVHPEIQRKVQQEIDEAGENADISYSALLSLKLLDQVISESLRLWPTGFIIDRLCVKDYPIATKLNEFPTTIEKGVNIMIPVIAIHRDPEYFPNPDTFDPERFSEQNRSKILPGTYMPFGAGPRNCIGSRFALLEIKTLFFHLLRRFDITVTDKTEIPIKIGTTKPSLLPENGIWLAFKQRR